MFILFHIVIKYVKKFIVPESNGGCTPADRHAPYSLLDKNYPRINYKMWTQISMKINVKLWTCMVKRLRKYFKIILIYSWFKCRIQLLKLVHQSVVDTNAMQTTLTQPSSMNDLGRIHPEINRLDLDHQHPENDLLSGNSRRQRGPWSKRCLGRSITGCIYINGSCRLLHVWQRVVSNGVTK